MSERTPQGLTQSEPEDNNWSETEALSTIHVCYDVVVKPSNEPIPPAVLEWLKTHQYLLQPPTTEANEDKDGKDEKK